MSLAKLLRRLGGGISHGYTEVDLKKIRVVQLESIYDFFGSQVHKNSDGGMDTGGNQISP